MKKLSRADIHLIVDYLLDKHKDIRIVAFNESLLTDDNIEIFTKHLANRFYIIK